MLVFNHQPEGRALQPHITDKSIKLQRKKIREILDFSNQWRLESALYSLKEQGGNVPKLFTQAQNEVMGGDQECPINIDDDSSNDAN